MAVRTIMIFPKFEHMEVIQEIRKKYDPLHGLVEPHITLVFPFEEETLSNEILERRLSECLEKFSAFPLALQGISKEHDAYGHYLFLNVIQGMDELVKLHDQLYEVLWHKKDDIYYYPHMTIGKLRAQEELEKAYLDVKNLEETFHAIVNKISVEMIGPHEESIIL